MNIMAQTGVELIAQERKEQIEKHGFSVSEDQYYSQNQLIQAALFCIDQKEFHWPQGWQRKFGQKIANKDRIGQLKVAGAFIAFEIDRILYNENKIENTEEFKGFM